MSPVFDIAEFVLQSSLLSKGFRNLKGKGSDLSFVTRPTLENKVK